MAPKRHFLTSGNAPRRAVAGTYQPKSVAVTSEAKLQRTGS
jgi:hypothetical protein